MVTFAFISCNSSIIFSSIWSRPAVSKAQAEIDEDKAKEMERKFRKAEFNFEDYLDQLNQMKKMGGIKDILNMMPGMSSQLKGMDIDDDMSACALSINVRISPMPRIRLAIRSG
mgnify:CR=1 FL=1